jgi:hypothetical protein
MCEKNITERNQNVMRYYGKKRLYQFLVEHEYVVPPLSQMQYIRVDGVEWLKSAFIEVEAEYGFYRSIEIITYTVCDDELVTSTYDKYCFEEFIFRIDYKEDTWQK